VAWITQTVILSGFALVFGTLGIGALLGAWDFGLSAGAGMIGLLLVTDGALLAAAALFAGRGSVLIDVFAIAVVLANAAASVADDVGPADLATFALSLVAVTLIILNSRTTRQRAKLPRAASDS